MRCPLRLSQKELVGESAKRGWGRTHSQAPELWSLIVVAPHIPARILLVCHPLQLQKQTSQGKQVEAEPEEVSAVVPSWLAVAVIGP